MPLKKCSKDGESGWKYGDSGTCYTGPDGKKKAIKQGLAINKGKWSEAELKEMDSIEGMRDLVAEVMRGEDFSIVEVCCALQAFPAAPTLPDGARLNKDSFAIDMPPDYGIIGESGDNVGMTVAHCSGCYNQRPSCSG